MRHGNTYIAGVGVAIGQPESIEHALRTGQISLEGASRSDQRSVAIAGPDATGASLAANGALDALVETGTRHAQIGGVYHAATAPTTGYRRNGASDVMSHIGLYTSRHPVQTFENGDQGVIDALSAAALFLGQRSPTAASFALVTAGDIWSYGTFNRWSHPTPPGDGGGAFVLTTTPTDVALLSTASRTDVLLGGIGRYEGPPEAIAERVTRLLLNVANDALEDARLKPTDITRVVTPFGVQRTELSAFLPYTAISESRLAPLDARRREIGHLGAADLIAAWHCLMESDVPLASGDRVLFLADSRDASAGAAVIEIR